MTLLKTLSRIGVAIESALLARFDAIIAKQGYTNRSEAFPYLIQDRLVGTAVENPEAPVVGSITLIYAYHSRLLPDRVQALADLLIGTKGVQHGRLVISSPKTYLSKTG